MVKDKQVHNLIEQLREKYYMFISNSFVKNYLFEADVPKSVRVGIEDLLDVNHYYESMGYDLNNLYDQLLCFARFLHLLRNEVVPRMQREFRGRLGTLDENNQVIFKMTVNNAPGNLRNFYEIAGDLFLNVLRIDESENGDSGSVFRKHADYREIRRLLEA